jgi:hypothetical protein
MTADNTDTPLGHVDEGVPIYIVHDEDQRALSHHRTEQGARAAMEGYGAAAGISIATLYR